MKKQNINTLGIIKRIISLFITLVTIMSILSVSYVSSYAENVATVDQVASTSVDNVDNIDITQNLSYELRYDDCFHISDIAQGYVLYKTVDEKITSYKVSKGKVSSSLDKNLVEKTNHNDNEYYASAVGKGSLILVTQKDYDLLISEKSASSVEAIKVDLTVTPAPLTMVLMLGQSNVEGYCSANTGYHPEDSVVCEYGQVYSSYPPAKTTNGRKVSGISNISAGTKDNAKDHIVGALGGGNAISISGKELLYTPYSLTQYGQGKTGPDSAFAYEWHRLTNDKVWVVNCAYGGTTIGTWIEGGNSYERALAIYNCAAETYDAEINSGHYTKAKVLGIWLQGESNRTSTVEVYSTAFEKCINLLIGNMHLDKLGVIIPRGVKSGLQNTWQDLVLTSPRIVQPYFTDSKDYENLYMVSRVNELWGTDSGVAEYFSDKYPDGYFTYPLRSNSTLVLPTTVAQVHNDVHYAQVAHNENGIDSARNMNDVFDNEDSEVLVSVLRENGSFLDTDSYNTLLSKPFVLGFRYTLPQKSKNYRIVTDDKYLQYNAKTASFTPVNSGTTYIKVVDSFNVPIYSLTVYIDNYNLYRPKITDVTNTATGSKITWSAVDGADYYRVFVKSGSKWKSLATTQNTYYTHENLTSGKEYTYTVRCLSKDKKNYTSSYYKEGFTNCFLSAPKLRDTVNTTKGVVVKFKEVEGAKRYRVYVKTASSKSWQELGETTKTSYTHKTAESNTKYTYTVRCISADGEKLQSVYDKKGITKVFYSAPKITNGSAQYNKVSIEWEKVEGVTYYRVFKKDGDKWKRLADTKSLSFTDYNATIGKENCYTVRCLSDSKKSYISSYYSDNFVANIPLLETPYIKSATSTNNGVKLTWDKVDGASYYRVFKKTSSGWKAIKTTSKTSFTDSGAVRGKKYTYTVRCVSGDKKYYTSKYDKKGCTHKFA